MTMRICIFEAGLPPDQYIDVFGSYPAMTRTWLSGAFPEAAFSECSVVRGAALPDSADAFDGYIITGSKHGVYEDLSWMQALKDFLLGTRAARKPVFGICFGHQIMAAAFGGKVRKSDKGWGIGAQEYSYEQDAGLTTGASLLFHQDQVETVPEGARIIGGNDFCPIGALEYDFPALSVQYPPEFGPAYVSELIRLYGGDRVPQDVADRAMASLESSDVDNARVARRVADFFREHA